MASHHVSIKGFAAALRARGREVPAACVEALREAGDMLAGPVIQHEIAAAKAVDLGQYAASWSSKPVPGGCDVSSSAPQAVWIERGRGPGPVPLAPIKAWAARHGMDESAAYPIAKKIAESGTAPRWVLRKATERIRPLIGRLVQRQLEALG